MGREFITAQIGVKLLLWNRLGLLKLMALLLLMLVAAGPPGASGAMEEEGMKDALGWCLCYQLLNTSEYQPCRLKGTDCHGILNNWENSTEVRRKNCTPGDKGQDFQNINDSLKTVLASCGGGDTTTIQPMYKGPDFFIIILASSAGVLMLTLLSVGIMSMTLKKWRNRRIFKKLKRWDNFLFKSKAVDYQPDTIYINVINLVVQKEDEFAIYANVPSFQWPKKTLPVITYAPDQVENSSIVFL